MLLSHRSDAVNDAYAAVFHVDIAPMLHSAQRGALVPVCAAPTLRVAALGRVSPEVVLANQRALLFNAQHCWAPGCAKTPAHLGRCARCHVAGFCSKECQTQAWPEHRPECALYVKVQQAVAASQAQSQ